MENEQDYNEQKPSGESKRKFVSDETLNKISAWTLENLPAVIAIAVAALLPHVVGFITGLAIYALAMYYKTGGNTNGKDNDKNEQD